MKIFLLSTLLAFAGLLSGCATGSQPQPIGENPLDLIAVVDRDHLFASDREVRKIAFTKNGLILLDLDSGSEQKLSSQRPRALAWGRDGSKLAAAFQAEEYETRLELFSHQGELLQELVLPVALTQMTWSERGDLLATGFALKTYSFGSNLRQSLYQLHSEQVKETVLSDTTLKPATSQHLKPIMQSLQPVTFSPYGDELVFASLHDPPEFPPYLRLHYLNWMADRKRSLQDQPVQPFQVEWGKSGDSITLINTRNKVEFDLWPAPNDSIMQPVSRNYRFTEGRLYHGDDLLADWGKEAQLQILPDGRFLLAAKKNLFLGDGLDAVLQEDGNEKRWTLRRWRFEGLITPTEYLESLRKENP